MTLKQTTKMLVLFMTYILVFAAIMQAVERTEHDQRPENHVILQSLWINIQQKYNMTREEFDNITWVIHQSQSNIEIWDYQKSVMFIVALCTTIGYGNITPKTLTGRILTITTALFGIPLTLVTLNSIGSVITDACTKIIVVIETRLLKRTAVKRMNIKCFTFVLIALLLILFIGAGALTSVTDWSFDVSFYFWFITLSTVGFGDYVIGSENVTHNMDGWAILFSEIAYIILTLIGLALLASVIDCAVKLTHAIKCRHRSPCCCTMNLNDVHFSNEQSNNKAKSGPGNA